MRTRSCLILIPRRALIPITSQPSPTTPLPELATKDSYDEQQLTASLVTLYHLSKGLHKETITSFSFILLFFHPRLLPASKPTSHTIGYNSLRALDAQRGHGYVHLRQVPEHDPAVQGSGAEGVGEGQADVRNHALVCGPHGVAFRLLLLTASGLVLKERSA